jgi:hypothetical protein
VRRPVSSDGRADEPRILNIGAASGTSVEPDLSKWDAWRPTDAARLFAGVQAPWYIAAGWAIDLFLGGQRREHEDLEIAVPQLRFAEIAEALKGFELFVPVGPGRVRPLVGDELPETGHQTWVREPRTGLWRLDVFREPSEGDTWICRRDARIRLPYSDVIERTEAGIPYLRPEIVLLFKAKHAERPRDQADFADVVPRLEPERRRWLADALALVHPGHAWLEKL